MTTSTSTPTGTAVRRLVVATPVVLVTLWLVWATGLISIKFGLQHADPMAFAVLRVVTTTGLLGAALAVRYRRGDDPVPRSRVHRWALPVGMTQVVAFFTAQSFGMADADAGLSAILLYTQPFMVAVAARAVLSERLSPRQLVGMVLGWCGVGVLVGGEASAGTTPLHAMVLLLLAAVAWATSTILFKQVPTDIPLVPLLFWMNVYGIIPLLVFALGTGAGVSWGPELVLATLWTGAFAGIGGMGLSFVLLRRGEASVVSSWIFAVPIVTALLSVPVLGETLAPRLFVAGSLVALGIALVNWNRQQRRSPRHDQLQQEGSAMGHDPNLDHAVRELLDKQAIHEVLMRYCRGVDRCDEELIRSVYHPDGVDEHGIYASNGQEFARTIVNAKLAETQWCRHDVANHLVELDGDVALSEATFVSYQQKVDDDRVQVLAGRYVDRFERRDGNWRIARRLVVHDWSGSLTLGPWTLHTVPPELFVQGGRGEDDVVTGPGRRQLLG